MRKRLIGLLTVYLLLSPTLSGCWDYVEYEDLAQITALGSDYNPQTNEITITIQYPSIKRTKSGGAGGAETGAPEWVVHSATGQNTFDAMSKLQEVVPQRLFYGYIKVFIVGEEMARYKLWDLFALVDRTPVMRSSAYIAVAEGTAEYAIKTIDPSQLSAGDKIHKLIQLIPESGSASAVTMNELLEDLAIGGLEPSIPLISIEATTDNLSGKTGQKQSGEGKKDEKAQEPQGKQATTDPHKEHPGMLRIGGMAAFHGDKLVGKLDDRESRGVNFIRGKKIHAYKVSEAAGETAVDQLYFRILESKSAIKVRLENGRPTVAVTIGVKADLRKYYGHEGADFLFGEALDHIEEKLAESVRGDVEAALKRGQGELRTDIFGFGFALYRKYPRAWKEEFLEQWRDIFPDIPVTVQINAKVVNVGITTRKLYIK